jgi:hypothetical protein
MADWLFQKKLKMIHQKKIKNNSMIHQKKLRLREERESYRTVH